MLSLMAWVLPDLEALAELRQRIDPHSSSAHDAAATFNRVIAGLLESIFCVADATRYP